MKLLSFTANDAARFGAVTDDNRVVDLVTAMEGRYVDLKDFLTNGKLEEAQEALAAATTSLAMDEIQLEPVIPNPGKIWCCGLNYGEHVRETNREINEKPTFFLRFPESQVAHGEAIMRPRESTMLDYEGELAIIIGKGGRRIAEEDIWDHIIGYAPYNDGSVRDWQRHSQQWDPGKNFWKTGGFGPWMVTSDEIEPNKVMQVTTRLNGEILQQATTDMMIHSIARQVAYTSTVAPLSPGDVIVTGTPGGVGARRDPQVWMKPGDVVEIEIEGVGTLTNRIEQD